MSQLLTPAVCQHIGLGKVTINLKFPCKVFLVVTVSSSSLQLTKFQSRSVDLTNNCAIFDESFQVADPHHRPLDILYNLHIETKNGVKMAGKVTDILRTEEERKERILRFVNCPDRNSELRVAYRNQQVERSIVTNITGNEQDNYAKLLKEEKGRLESSLALVELENYQKDILIKNLNIELKLKGEENKYLFNAEKLKELSNQYQQEARQTKVKLAAAESQNRQLKIEIQQLKRDLSCSNRQKQDEKSKSLLALTRALQRISKCLQMPTLQDLVEPILTDPSQEYDHLGEILGRRIKSFEGSVYALKTKCKDRTVKINDLCYKLKESQSTLEKIKQQKQIIEQENQQQLITIDNLNEKMHTLSTKVQQNQRYSTLQLKNLQQQNSSLAQQLSELKLETQQLFANEIKRQENQTKLKHNIQQKQESYIAQIERYKKQLIKYEYLERQLNASNKQIQILEQHIEELKSKFSILQFQKLQLEEEKVKLSLKNEQVVQKLLQAQEKIKEQQKRFEAAASRSRNSLKQITNTNISIGQSYNKLMIEAQYRLNQQRSEKNLLKLEYQQMKAKFQSQIQNLRNMLSQKQFSSNDLQQQPVGNNEPITPFELKQMIKINSQTPPQSKDTSLNAHKQLSDHSSSYVLDSTDQI